GGRGGPRSRAGAVLVLLRPVRADLRQPVHLHLPLCGAARADRRRRACARRQLGLHVGRGGGAGAGDPGIYRLGVLGVPRQGRGRGLPLMPGAHGTRTPGPLWKRLLWFAALWLGGLAAVGLVAWTLRLWIG